MFKLLIMERVSMALYLWNSIYYMQIIDSNEEHFFVTITTRAAMQINAVCGCGIHYEEVLTSQVTD